MNIIVDSTRKEFIICPIRLRLSVRFHSLNFDIHPNLCTQTKM